MSYLISLIFFAGFYIILLIIILSLIGCIDHTDLPDWKDVMTDEYYQAKHFLDVRIK